MYSNLFWSKKWNEPEHIEINEPTKSIVGFKVNRLYLKMTKNAALPLSRHENAVQFLKNQEAFGRIITFPISAIDQEPKQQQQKPTCKIIDVKTNSKFILFLTLSDQFFLFFFHDINGRLFQFKCRATIYTKWKKKIIVFLLKRYI